MMARARLAARFQGVFVASVGPGSFTSLRIGIATLKGLAFGTACPVAPVPTLEALALAADRVEGRGAETVVPVLDARRGEVYAVAPGFVPEGVYTPEELASRLHGTCVVVGEGVAVCGLALRRRLGPEVRLVPPPAGVPAARHVGTLGAGMLAAGGGVDVAALVPRYVRRAEAEVKRTGWRFEPGPSASGGGSPTGTLL